MDVNWSQKIVQGERVDIFIGLFHVSGHLDQFERSTLFALLYRGTYFNDKP
jgi:hypothetical protein